MMRVLIYSDQPVLAKGLQKLLCGDPALEVKACCLTLAAVTAHLANQVTDLAVLDLTPSITFSTLHDLKTLAPQCKLILWTYSVSGHLAMQALTAGVRGILRKTLPVEAHRQCLHRVYAGGLWFDTRFGDSVRAARRVSLTHRESQLVSMLARGLTNREISGELGLKEGTIKVYLSHLFLKSGAKDRLDLAINGLKNLSATGIAARSQGQLRSLVMESARGRGS